MRAPTLARSLASCVAVLGLGCQTSPEPVSCPAIPADALDARVRGSHCDAYEFDDQQRVSGYTRDRDCDGTPEEVAEYDDGKITARRVDGDGDGRFDTWVRYSKSGLEVRHDSDGDGEPDEALDAEAFATRELDAKLRAEESRQRNSSCKTPECLDYAREVRRRVANRLERRTAGLVVLELKVGVDGCPYDLGLLQSTSKEVSRDALAAIKRSCPLPLPPEEVEDRLIRTRFSVTAN